MSKQRSGRLDKKQKRKGKERGWRSAATSDRHELYELSVQDVESECDLIDRVWEDIRGRKARSIREDFCGTAAASMEWVRRRKKNTAIAVDIDQEVLAWGRAKAEERLAETERARIEWREENVLEVQTPPVDAVLAMNFSYYLFRTREAMKNYFVKVREALVEDGLFLLDAYGGSEAFSELEEERDLDGFTYVWDQHVYHPVTGYALNYIHFHFPDGSKMREAFRYEWRLWTLPEIQELLLEAGFKKVTVYWEGADEEGDGNGEFEPTKTGEACEGWIAYLAAEM